MTNLMLRTGRIAKNPYDWEQLEVSVSSIEELCFQIVRNRYVIGQDSFTRDLFDWIDIECGLKELADNAKKIFSKSSLSPSVAETVAYILSYVGYNTADEIRETVKVLEEFSNLDIYEKHLARADFLMENEHYHQAFDAYDKLLRSVSDSEENKQIRLLMSEGIMNARMFAFSRAAELFRQAYEIRQDKEIYLRYLAAMRMKMTEKEYLDFVADDQKAYQLSMPLESLISEAEERYTNSKEHEKVKELMKSKSTGDKNAYYRQVFELTEQLKKEYRGGLGLTVRD